MTFRYLGLRESPPALCDYQETWDYQRAIHAQVADGTAPPHVLFVEHPPVYTAGRRTLPHERPADGTAVVDVDRGGKITWHGPGQLVGYPIVPLPRQVGPLGYVRRLEEAIIRMLAELGVASGRVDGRTGVWLPASPVRPERKICAIGIRVARQTTMHGFAFNVTAADGFAAIVPCGISDAGVTTLLSERPDAPTSLVEIGEALEPHLAELLAWKPFHTAAISWDRD